MQLIKGENSFIIKNKDIVIIEHTLDKPFVYVGIGKEDIKQHYGDFKITDKLIEKIPLTNVIFHGDIVSFSNCNYEVNLKISINNNRVAINDFKIDEKINRIFLNIKSHNSERIYGCGEQFSYLNLKGRDFPIWTTEPGVGRDRTSYISFQADRMGIGGGDYYTTNYPQPTYISDSKYLFHMETGYYSKFDFIEDNYTEITIWGTPDYIFIEGADSFVDLMNVVTKEFGTQPLLPKWALDGVILGMQGGTDVVYSKIKEAKKQGINVSGVWCQDWVGKKMTSFGKRLRWRWQKDENTYPDLEDLIKELDKEGIKYLAYINPYLLEGTELFDYASKNGYFVKRENGEDYIADFGEFFCGSIDFTNNYAMKWYKSIIKKNMIDIGIAGWMADFGEYIPVDAIFSNGKTGEEMHNRYPALWAKCNYEAIKESGKLGEVVYFMRSGGIGNAKYCTLMWAGDQSVDFTIHDGLASTIPAGISLGLLGNGLTHFDIGGYTSLFGNVRNEELMLRYLEYSVFTAVMRTHEGNRPSENFQYDQSENCMRQFAIFSDLRKQLLPYISDVIKENTEKGLGTMRPLFMHYEDKECLDIAYEYLFGRDILVAPVYETGIKEWQVYLPEDEWVHLFTKEEYRGGKVTVNAELGNIPVFYRKKSQFEELFKNVKKNKIV